jgi:hypothetical protein
MITPTLKKQDKVLACLKCIYKDAGMSKTFSSDLTASGQERPALELIDAAVGAAKEAAHACRSEAGRECFEFALALLRESWIAESGQNARGAEKVIADVKWGLRLIAAVFAKEGK